MSAVAIGGPSSNVTHNKEGNERRPAVGGERHAGPAANGKVPD